MSEQHLNVFNEGEVEILLDIYSKRDYHIDSEMKIYAVGDNEIIKLMVEEKISPLIDSRFCPSWDNSHFYSHEHSYFLHTDYQPKFGELLNVVIPLQNDYPSSLIVFDQRWRQWPVTWFFDYPLIYIPTNPAIKGAPHEYPIENKTDQPIDIDFYNNYLADSWGEMHDYHGLSGIAHEHISGSAIVFDASKIHGTSKMSGSKTGLVIRYKLK
jgi:hypothetical protein